MLASCRCRYVEAGEERRETCRIYESSCRVDVINTGALRGKNTCTYSGAMPNNTAVMNNDITPPKNVTFSLVRTIFADCHEAESEVIR